LSFPHLRFVGYTVRGLNLPYRITEDMKILFQSYDENYGSDLALRNIHKLPEILGTNQKRISINYFWGKMERVKGIKEGVFDTILIGAIEDLRKCGLDDEEIFPIIEEQFGLRCARKYVEKARNDS
jgi:hypothetical protein